MESSSNNQSRKSRAMNRETNLITSSLEDNKEINELKLKDEQNLKDYENQSGVYIFIIESNKDDEYIYFNVDSTSNITEEMINIKSIYKKMNKNAYLYLFHPTIHYLELEEIIRNEFLSQNITKITL